MNTEEHNNMAYCEEDCQMVSINNGYYVNSDIDYGIIICESSLCRFLDEEDINEKCYRNYYEIIFDQDNFQYCHNLTLIDMPNEELYYPISLNLKTSKFPSDVETGLDTIITKINKYSVQQFISDDNGKNYKFQYILFFKKNKK